MPKFVVANLKYSGCELKLDSVNFYIVPSNFMSGERNSHIFFFSVLYYYYSVLLIYVWLSYTQQFEYPYAELIVSRQNFHVIIHQYAPFYLELIANFL